MTRFCAGEDSWLARRSNNTSDPGTSEVRDGNGKPRRNKHKRRNNNEGTQDTAVNAGFSGSKTGQRKKPFKANRDGPSNLDKILDRPCQIHGTPDKPANHTNRSCWVFKQAGKLNAKHKGKGPPSDSDDEETRQPNTGGQKQFPPEVKTVNMVYVTHIPTEERKRALQDANAIELGTPKLSQWVACPITFDRKGPPSQYPSRKFGSFDPRSNYRWVPSHESPYGQRQ
jgi:hypothetical protein